MIRSTLCYIENNNDYLMLLRNKKDNDPNSGKWIGVGGKFLPGEGPEACMLREVREETGLVLTDYEYKGIIDFRSDEFEDEEMHLFTAHSDTRDITSCDEGDLKWIPASELLTLPLWEGDKFFLRHIINGKKHINMTIVYKGSRLLTACDKDRFSPFKAFFLHLHTINRHRRLVRRGCFKVGLYWQGLTHDLSKYSPTEFLQGVRYFQGTRSPNVAERMDKGYSEAWLHHKGRNKHHFEYWTDYSFKTGKPLEYVEMPRKYFVESIMDRIAASKVYRGKTYTDAAAYEYLTTRESERHMHEKNYEELVFILGMLKDKGEKETFRYIKKEYLKKKKDFE